MVTQNHASEDALEQYVRAKLTEEEAAPVEEHLLVCPRCCERVAWLDEIVESIRTAAHTASRAAAAGHRG
ncbi:MAG: zf-HC2 domain-containing protein [Bryobacteraceae bacterium]